METAYIMINCEMGAEGAIVDGVKTIDDVKEVSGVFGNYDIIIKVECSDIEDLRDIITRKIRHLDQVKCTTTLMCAN
ncbi:Transcriptional regulator, AsnC family [Nitrosotalea sinensis]|uniref:Transcriptional regulator, AsnC family n=2 Tax=Nitrosotalea sinensis TaxID=1499975 RepID=A0A2H1EHB7_9ARCH|nr:Transcriptional regulator, AsnC family [Candidatus Nitrosotalea sinensis]